MVSRLFLRGDFAPTPPQDARTFHEHPSTRGTRASLVIKAWLDLDVSLIHCSDQRQVRACVMN